MATLVILLASAAHADGAVEARDHYERGMAHYALGEYAQAAEEYQEAFRLKQDPALLYNAAQAYRLAGNREKAIVLYRNYTVLFPNEPNVDLAREQITRLKEAIDAEPTSPPTAQPAKPAQQTNLTPTPFTPKSEPALAVAVPVARVPARKSRALVLGIVIGGVAAAALAVGLGVGLTEHPRDPVPTIGAWTLK